MTWVVLALCQLAVTVAGNLAVIPLTGVTFPFVSFGMTSLVVNMAMLGLAINVNAQGERREWLNAPTADAAAARDRGEHGGRAGAARRAADRRFRAAGGRDEARARTAIAT